MEEAKLSTVVKFANGQTLGSVTSAISDRSYLEIDQEHELFFCASCDDLVVSARVNSTIPVLVNYGFDLHSEVRLSMQNGHWNLSNSRGALIPLKQISVISTSRLTRGMVFKRFVDGIVEQFSALSQMTSGRLQLPNSDTLDYIMTRNAANAMDLSVLVGVDLISFVSAKTYVLSDELTDRQ